MVSRLISQLIIHSPTVRVDYIPDLSIQNCRPHITLLMLSLMPASLSDILPFVVDLLQKRQVFRNFSWQFYFFR